MTTTVGAGILGALTTSLALAVVLVIAGFILTVRLSNALTTLEALLRQLPAVSAQTRAAPQPTAAPTEEEITQAGEAMLQALTDEEELEEEQRIHTTSGASSRAVMTWWDEQDEREAIAEEVERAQQRAKRYQ